MPVFSMRRLQWFVTMVGSAIVIIVSLLIPELSGLHQSLLMSGAFLPLIGLMTESRAFHRFRPGIGAPADDVAPDAMDRARFETWRNEVCRDLQAQHEQLKQQRQKLTDRLQRYHEFLEYPTESPEVASDQPAVELSSRDREVQRILEQEAERVYEKIRSDGYRPDGQPDYAAMRAEAFALIQRVARVYSPDSQNPLLETSFDQLARAASRVCLQALVLVERLPLDVQHYTINQLYVYLQRAISAWGTWQTVSPWMKHMSRGLYAGRLAAGASPVTLGAWWLATELGRRGTRKVVDHYVDQTAIAFFNDAVRLIGNEVACVYGPGVRQRDPAWVYGAELTELQQRFPSSRESLQAGLREITGLPLRSEYDRVYLYRCLAEHKSSGRQLSDPATLSRNEREQIALRLEQFFADNIHGAQSDRVDAWRDSVESRLDLRLNVARPATSAQATDPLVAARSVLSFLTGVGGLTTSDALSTLQSGQLFQTLDTEQIRQWEQSLEAELPETFEAPELDPADPLTDTFLKELIHCCVRAPLFDDAINTLLVEVGRYFRRSDDELQQAISEAWMRRLHGRTLPDAPVPRGIVVPARQLLPLLRPDESVAGIYRDVELSDSEVSSDVDPLALWLVVLRSAAGRRLLLLDGDQYDVIWQADDDCQVQRVSGLVIDSCRITGGQWKSERSGGTIVLPGRFGRSFQSLFGPLAGD